MAHTQRHVFGLVGRTLGHSWSPLIHKRLGSVPYDLVELEPDELSPFLRDGAWRGLNVTIPYKRQAFEAADEASPAARAIGVANTLVRRTDGTVWADNTDVAGFAYLLDRFCRRHLGGTAAEVLAGAEVLVLGSGGASQAVQAALADVGARTCVISRKGPDTYDHLTERHPGAVLVVNTTPVGMYPHCPASPVDEQQLAALPALRGVLDVVYNPRRTGICQAAERLGLPSESGLAMLVAQAWRSSESFQGHPIDASVVDEIERDIQGQTENVILIGMPGSGKTTTGRRVAHLLHRPFVDMDDAFAMEYGTTAAQCIVDEGEPAFRRRESDLLARTASRSGLVIACGGGVVTQPANYPLLHQNGTIVMLDRPLDTLEVTGRPLSELHGIRQLAQERMPIYRAWADVTLPTTGTPQGDAAELLGLLPGFFAHQD